MILQGSKTLIQHGLVGTDSPHWNPLTPNPLEAVNKSTFRHGSPRTIFKGSSFLPSARLASVTVPIARQDRSGSSRANRIRDRNRGVSNSREAADYPGNRLLCLAVEKGEHQPALLPLSLSPMTKGNSEKGIRTRRNPGGSDSQLRPRIFHESVQAAWLWQKPPASIVTQPSLGE